MSQVLHVDDNDHADDDNNDDAKAIAIPRVFSENSRAKIQCGLFVTNAFLLYE